MEQRVSRESGYSVVELLVAMAVFVVVGGMILMTLLATSKANSVIVPASKRIVVRKTVLDELRTAQAGGARLGFFDSGATLRSVLGSGSSSSSAKGDTSGSGPGGGKGGDGGGTGGTGGGKDPGGGGGGGGTGSPTSHVPLGSSNVTGQYAWGTGVLVGGTRVFGPVAVWETKSDDLQLGPTVVTVRAEPGMPGLRLAENFVTASGRIRLVASSSDDATRLGALVTGDLLYVNGLTVDGAAATAIASVTSDAVEIPTSSLADPTAAPTMRTFELTVDAPNAAYAYGLSNGDDASKGLTIASDASVTLLDRSAPVVCYYTARYNPDPEGRNPRDTSTLPIGLFRAVGDPAAPDSLERVLDEVGTALTATLTYESTPTGTAGPADEQVLAIGFPLLATDSRSNADLVRCTERLPARPSALSLSILSAGGGR